MAVPSWQLSGALAAVVLASSSGAAADVTCPVLRGTTQASTAQSVSIEEANDRIWAIEQTIDAEARASSLWATAWGAGGLALAAGGVGLGALTSNRHDRTDDLVGAASSLLIPLILMIAPPHVLSAATTLRQLRFADPCERLAVAERELQRTRDNDAFTAGVIAHAAVIGFNVGVGLVLGVGLGHWRGAVMNGVGGLAVSEAQLLTRPHDSIAAFAAYQHANDTPPERRLTWSLVPWLERDTAGLRLVGGF